MGGTRTALFSRKVSGGIFTVDDAAEHPGDIFFVGSTVTGATDSVGAGKSPDKPLATIDYAIGLCTADQGDVIYVLPGHAEAITAAGGIAVDVAGISIIGLGLGSNRPTISFGGTGATVAVSAANCTLKNLRVKATVDEVVSMFNVTAAYCTLDNIEYVDNGATAQTLQFLLTSAAADYLTVKNCVHYQSTAPNTASSWIQLIGTDVSRIVDNVFMVQLANSASSFLINGSTAVVMCEIARNVLHMGTGNTIAKIVTLAATSTGHVHDNRACSGTGVSTANAFDIASAFAAENYWNDTVNTSGLLAPGIDTDT